MLTLILHILLVGVCAEYFDIAWGTGNRIGEMSLIWAFLFAISSLGTIALFGFALSITWSDTRFMRASYWLIGIRERLAWGKWVVSFFVFLTPVFLLQFTLVGLVFPGIFFRLTLWAIQLFIIAWLLTKNDLLIEWRVLLISTIFTASLVTIGASMLNVTNYPFSLGWSEGNRLWDYSIMFGKNRYTYPAEQDIPVFLDNGRQFVGGIPFLFPFLTIGMERLWISLTTILPYLLLGMIAFRSSKSKLPEWIAGGFWCFLFLKQGPIHPPLILIAALVAFAWGKKYFISIPLIAAATVMATLSRFTWAVAPLGWFILFEVLAVEQSKPMAIRDQIVKYAGIIVTSTIGGLALIYIASLFFPQLNIFKILSPSLLLTTAQKQDLLWYRLLPNETFSTGILFGLIIAIAPSIFVLIRLIATKNLRLNFPQALLLSLGLFGYLSIGLIVSSKIGGGGDLHNMDMFLITVFFTGAIAWQNGGKEYLLGNDIDIATRLIMIAMFVIPALAPLAQIRSYDFTSRASWLVTIRDAPNEKSLQMRAGDEAVEKALKNIQKEMDAAKGKGEMVFIDQRQLLTFGFVENIPLVPDYDKKVLIENALSENREYYNKFYADLKNKRFSLIIVQPLSISNQGTGYEFGEENNAWVKWAAKPLLCYYDIKKTLEVVNVQMLVPKTGPQNCEQILP